MGEIDEWLERLRLSWAIAFQATSRGLPLLLAKGDRGHPVDCVF